MSSLAQEESRSISENTAWGKRKAFADGKVSVAFSHFLGYDKGFVINEEEAVTVRMIYKYFLMGYSMSAIKKELEKRERLTATGNKHWTVSAIESVYHPEESISRIYSRHPERGLFPEENRNRALRR